MVRWYGANLAWLIDPYDKVVHEYKPGVAPITHNSSLIHGSGPLEDLVVDVEEIWRCYQA
jgi:hypothetical protein